MSDKLLQEGLALHLNSASHDVAVASALHSEFNAVSITRDFGQSPKVSLDNTHNVSGP